MFYGLGYGLSICFVGTQNKCLFFCCWVKCSINVNQILLVDSVVSSFIFFCILSSLISCWERGIKFSNYNCGFVYFPFSFISFCFIYFGAPLFGAYIFRIAISSWKNDSFIIIRWPSLSSYYYFYWWSFSFKHEIFLVWWFLLET